MDRIVDEIDVREKTTAGIEVELKADDVAIPLQAIDHVEMHMLDGLGKVYRYTSAGGDLEITDAGAGKVMIHPPDTSVFQYTRSPYKLYFIVYETVTPDSHYSVPEDGYLKINVTKEF